MCVCYIGASRRSGNNDVHVLAVRSCMANNMFPFLVAIHPKKKRDRNRPR